MNSMWKLSIIFFLGLLCFTLPCYSATLQKVTLLTRNGARGMPTLINDQVTCDNACNFSESGKEMSLQLGKSLFARYRDALRLGARFEPNYVSFLAAETSRTILTGEAINKGMFPDSFPLVEYSEEDEDRMMSVTKSWPAWVLRDPWREKLHLDDSWAREKLSKDNIATLTKFLPSGSSDKLCYASPSLCATYIYDAWSVNASMGHEEPSLKPLIGIIKTITTRFMWRLYGTDLNNEIDLNVGPLAGPFIRKVLEDFASSDSKVKLSIKVGSMPLVFSLYTSLGVFKDDNTLAGSAPEPPYFGDAVALEYSKDAKNEYIRFYRFAYSLTTGSYTQVPLAVECMNAKGVTYLSTSTPDGCLSEDMRRYVDSLGSTNGQCFVSDVKLKAAKCDSDKAPPVGSLCYFYRSHCPGAPCGAVHGAIADPAEGFMCQYLQDNGSIPYLTVTIISFGATAFFAGSVLGLFQAHRILKCLRIKR